MAEHECDQAEEIHDLKVSLAAKELILTDLQVKQAVIAGDVSHIKTRIDNGMSTSVKEIRDMLLELKPRIEHHSDIVKRIEDIGWLWSRYSGVGLISLLLGIVVWALNKGFRL